MEVGQTLEKDKEVEVDAGFDHGPEGEESSQTKVFFHWKYVDMLALISPLRQLTPRGL